MEKLIAKTIVKISFLFLALSFYLLAPSCRQAGINYCVKDALAAETLSFTHQDHLGSTNLITDDQGNIVSQQNYYPYGTTRAVQGGLPVNRQYTSQVSDQDQTGLYYYNARYYDPRAGKFTQGDTAQGPNRYVYVANNPTNYIDPSGHQYGGEGKSESVSSQNLFLSISHTEPINSSQTGTIPMPGTSEWNIAVASMPIKPPVPSMSELLTDPVTGPVMGATLILGAVPISLAVSAVGPAMALAFETQPFLIKASAAMVVVNTASDTLTIGSALIGNQENREELMIEALIDPTGFMPAAGLLVDDIVQRNKLKEYQRLKTNVGRLEKRIGLDIPLSGIPPLLEEDVIQDIERFGFIGIDLDDPMPGSRFYPQGGFKSLDDEIAYTQKSSDFYHKRLPDIEYKWGGYYEWYARQKEMALVFE